MQLINTDIVHPRTDVLWQQPQEIADVTPCSVLVITTSFENQAEADQLTGILKAGCKLNENQYKVVPLSAGNHIPWYRLRDAVKPRIVLLFHIYPTQLGISALFRLNEVNKFDGALWVPTVSLGQLITDKTLKGQLWNNALKPIFETQAFGNMLL